MAIYLNGNMKFKCSCSTVFFKPINASVSTNINSSGILLENTKLQQLSPNLCPHLQSPSGLLPCPCLFVESNWNNIYGDLKVDKKSVLIKSSYISCPKGFPEKILPFWSFKTINVTNSPKTLPFGGSGNLRKLSESKQEEVYSAKESEKQYFADDDNTLDNEDSIPKNLRNCKSCKKKMNCKFYTTSDIPLNIKWTKEIFSKVLRDNMKANSSSNYYEIEKIIKSVTDEYDGQNQAHHLISAKECFARVKKVVKLSNYFGFDINCAENGILLPSKESGGEVEIKNTAFEIMERLGMQWHKGPHNFDTRYDVKFSDAVNKAVGSKNIKKAYYEERVIKKLENIANQYDEVECIEEIDGNDFIQKMNHCAAYIREQLNKFAENPKASSPFYVSRTAWCFAFKEELKKFNDTEIFGQEK